jgi:hypothetical protein
LGAKLSVRADKNFCIADGVKLARGRLVLLSNFTDEKFFFCPQFYDTRKRIKLADISAEHVPLLPLTALYNLNVPDHMLSNPKCIGLRTIHIADLTAYTADF